LRSLQNYQSLALLWINKNALHHEPHHCIAQAFINSWRASFLRRSRPRRPAPRLNDRVL
jgi:hypothetical protein